MRYKTSSHGVTSTPARRRVPYISFPADPDRPFLGYEIIVVRMNSKNRVD